MHDTEAPTMTQAEQDAAAWRSTAGRYLSALEVAERQRDEVGIQLVAAQARTVAAFVAGQRAFSSVAFGPHARPAGTVDHIRKELVEIEADPTDVKEWIDVAILALDGAWRAGHEPEDIERALFAKLEKNKARTWPDWRTADPTKAIEHARALDAVQGDTLAPRITAALDANGIDTSNVKGLE